MLGATALAETPNRRDIWKAAYDEHAAAVLRFLSRRLGSREDAEDLLHETFVRAMRAEERLREPAKVRSYLFATAQNLLRNHHRRTSGVPFEVLGEEAERVADPGAVAADSAVFLRGLVERLASLADELSPAHRAAFQLGLVERLPYQEIAIRTGWSLSLVKVNVHRARRRLVEGLGEVVAGAVRRHFDGTV